MEKQLYLFKALTTTFHKSCICAFKKTNKPTFTHRPTCAPLPPCCLLQARVSEQEGLLATTLEVKQSREFLNKPLD